MYQAATRESMQADHSQWRAAHAEWRREIERWQAEHDQALVRLAQMQRAVQQHGEALSDHAYALQQAEKAVLRHDRALARQLSEGTEREQDYLMEKHREEEFSFVQHENAHERIRKHHQRVLSQLEALEKAATAAM